MPFGIVRMALMAGRAIGTAGAAGAAGAILFSELTIFIARLSGLFSSRTGLAVISVLVMTFGIIIL